MDPTHARPFFPRSRRHPGVPALAAGLLLLPLLLPRGADAQQAGYGQTFGGTPMERQLYEGGDARPSGGSLLDSTNPIDLMNKLRRGTALQDATPPASAIDAALRELESQGPSAPTGSQPQAGPAPLPQSMAPGAGPPSQEPGAPRVSQGQPLPATRP